MKKIVSLALVLMLCLSMLAGVVCAAEPEVYAKVTDGTLTSGKYVMVANNGKALAALDGSWALSADVVIEGDKVTNANGAIVTLAVEGTTVTITDANGKKIAFKSGSNNLQEGENPWNWKHENGTFTFDDGVTEIKEEKLQTRFLCSSGKDANNRFRAYRNPSAEPDNFGNTYFHLFTMYKLEEPKAPVETPDVPEHGDNTAIFAMMAMMAVSAAAIVVLNKKRAF